MMSELAGWAVAALQDCKENPPQLGVDDEWLFLQLVAIIFIAMASSR